VYGSTAMFGGATHIVTFHMYGKIVLQFAAKRLVE
jgi:hypothetical protein